jgi:putative ABC transport system ATP-binding protein
MIDSSPSATIQTRRLTMIYRSGKVEVVALRDVDLTVERGEFVAVMGPSGCGKSTLLHLLGGLQQPTGGQVLIDGTDLGRLRDPERTALRRKKIGYIFQRFNLLPTLSAGGNIELARRIQGNGQASTNGFDDALELLGIRGKLGFRPAELSGGEQQRVAIARALVGHPAIILADEPTGSLDSQNSRMVLGMLQKLNEQFGQTIVMITHDAEAAATAGRIVEMRDGEILHRSPHPTFEPEFEGLF